MNSETQAAPCNVVVFRVHEEMTPEEIDRNARRLELSLAPDMPTRVLLEIEGFRHMEPDLLTRKLRFLEPFAAKLERIAVIGGRVWLKSWIKVGAFPFPGLVEYFDQGESESAWRWLKE